MFKIAYAHDGVNVYDSFFLDHLGKNNIVYVLTFNANPRFAQGRSRIVKIPEPFAMKRNSALWSEGFRMYLFCLLRGLLLRIWLKHVKPDIVLGHMTTKYGFYSALTGFKPFILVIWGLDIVRSPKRSFFLRFMAKFTLKKADAVIVDSDIQRSAAIELGGNPDKILQFPWVDLDSVKVKVPRSAVRKQLGWRHNPIVISIRKHEPIYGLEYLIEAIPKIIKEVPTSRFLFLGKGSLSEKLKQRVKEMGLDPYVKFLGDVPRDDVFAYLNAADIYVSTSFSDGTSASLVEAMSLGIPPVVTEIAGNVEWIENGLSGLLVPVKNSQQLAEKITLLIKNQRLKRQIGQNASKAVKAKINWRKHSKTFDNLILTLVQKS